MMLAPKLARILYVDDEIDNLTIFKAAFRKLYHIHTALSAKEALQKMRSQSPEEAFDILITDQRMPEMTGVELLEIAALEFPQTVRMMLTGYSDMEAIIRAINKGRIFRYLTKPWEIDALRLTIDEAFLMAQQQRQQAAFEPLPQPPAPQVSVLAQLQQVMLPTEESLKAVATDALLFSPQAEGAEKSLLIFYRFADQSQSLLVMAANSNETSLKGTLFTLLVRHLADHIVIQGIRQPAELLAELQLNFCTVSRIMPYVVDLAIGALLIHHADKSIVYAGAGQDLLLAAGGKSEWLQGLPQPLGKENNAFSTDDFQQHIRRLPPHNFIYMATQGMIEQLCGLKNNSFRKNYFAQILEEMHSLSGARQKQLLQSLWDEWQAQQESLLHSPSTDALLIGISI
ncbi:response regulator [Rhodoflexus sp.]